TPLSRLIPRRKSSSATTRINGRLWLPKGKPIEVNMHDFPDKQLGKAAPYGVYDVGDDQGYVNVGIDPDTGEFSVASISRWWEHLGKKRYAKSTRLMITADSGGSNGTG